LNQSLDGYVDHDHEKFVPRPALFRHFIEDVRGLSGIVYGRRMYQIMRYWDEDHANWGAEEHEYAAAWRSQPKWVVSRSLKSAGPNATLVADDIDALIRGLKAQFVGEIEAGGPDLAGALTNLGLIDEYRLYPRHCYSDLIAKPMVRNWDAHRMDSFDRSASDTVEAGRMALEHRSYAVKGAHGEFRSP
jgi:dihydrofolate reductase